MVSSRSSSGPFFCGDERAIECQRIRASIQIEQALEESCTPDVQASTSLEQSSGLEEDTRVLSAYTSGYKNIREVTGIYERLETQSSGYRDIRVVRTNIRAVKDPKVCLEIKNKRVLTD